MVHYSGRGVKGEDSAGSVCEERAFEVRVKPHAYGGSGKLGKVGTGYANGVSSKDAYASIRQHTSAYAYASIRQHTCQ